MTLASPKAILAALKETIGQRKKTAPVRLLVVDDEEQIRYLLGRILNQAGYVTAIAKNGIEALSIHQAEGPFDVLLTDLIMPEMAGDELARQLRALQPDLPVLYLTGFCDRLFVEREMLWQGEAFLEKPFTSQGLIEAVSLIVSMPAGLSS